MKKSVYVDDSFPRDFTDDKTESKDIKKGRKRPAGDLENEDENILPVPKKQKTGDKSKNDIRQKPLSFHLQKDLLILGCVNEIKDYEVLVTLPDGMKGVLPITDISDAYTQKLQQLASGDGMMDEDDDKLLSLHNIFHPGSLVRCCITDLDTSSKKKAITLSINPKLVNRELVEIKDKTTISGAISSLEDHGFEIDVGISGMKAFLSKQEVSEFMEKNKDFPENIDFSIGSYLTCLVQMKKNEKKVISRVVSLTLNPKKVGSARHTESALHTLLPGVVVSCTVDSKVEAGIVVQFGNNNAGIIFNNNLEGAQDKYEIGDELTATVLYIQPSSKVVVLSQLKHLQNPAVYENPFRALEVGNTVEGQVIKVVPKVGIYLKLEGNVKAFVKKNQVSDKSADLKKFKKGDNHKCRVIGYDFLNRVVLVTMKESLLKMAFFNYQDIKLGQVIACTVKKLNSTGAIVKVTGRISGLVPRLHLSDVPLTNPEKMFKVGREVKCRVLSVNTEESKMVLTHKQSLLKPKNLLPYSYEEIAVKSLLTGFVVMIKSTGLLVAFGGEVKGWVPKKDLSYEIIDNPEKKFYLGQVVECRVKFCNPEETKLVLSLRLSEEKKTVEVKGQKVKVQDDKDEGPEKMEPEAPPVEENKETPVVKCGEAKQEREPKLKVLELPCQFNWENLEENSAFEPLEEPEREISKKVRNNNKLNKQSQEKRTELEKLTLLEPNNSQNWINLIGFEMEEGDLEKAREVSDRAIASISFREEQERLNVSLCRLNLEHSYGTPESLKKYYYVCLSSCDPLKTMSHMRDLKAGAKEFNEAVEICKMMIKKFKDNPDVWVSYGLILYKFGQLENARALLRRSVELLEEKNHVFVATKFALLESEYGSADMSDTMFENILKNFPKRTDIWSIYIDRCIKLLRDDQARNVLRRATSIEPPLPAKKASFLLKKYISFEEARGSPLIVDELKGRLAKITKEDEQ